MTLKTTTVAIEAVVLLGIFVAVEWLAHVFTSTRNMFAPAVLFGGIYVVLRIVISARKARHAGDTPHST
jgi:hypothetical protein